MFGTLYCLGLGKGITVRQSQDPVLLLRSSKPIGTSGKNQGEHTTKGSCVHNCTCGLKGCFALNVLRKVLYNYIEYINTYSITKGYYLKVMVEITK
jgi:hypothetical protein